MHVHEYMFRSARGVTLSLQRWTGQPILIVNTASASQHAPQLHKLQELHQEYMPSVLVVLATPCNYFGEKEPLDGEELDAHYWDVWHRRKPFTAYRSQYPRFMSEFGFQSLPPFETIRSYAEPEDWNMTSYIMEYHQRGNHGNGLILALPHSGNWELIGDSLINITPATALFRPPRMQIMDGIMRAGRARTGVTPVPIDRQGLKALHATLQRGEAVVILPDAGWKYLSGNPWQ